jgi:hypothetical protein
MFLFYLGNTILFTKLSYDIMNQIVEKRYTTNSQLYVCVCMLLIFIMDLVYFYNKVIG